MNQQPADRDSTRTWAQPAPGATDCDLVDDTIEAYALGVAEPSETVAIERHLLRCKRCAALVDSFHETVAALAFSVPLVAPRAESRSALMHRISATPQYAPLTDSVFTGSLSSLQTPTLPASNSVAAPLPAQPAPARQAWWRVYAAPLATLPLLLALGLMSAWGFNNYAKLGDANTTIDQQANEMAQMQNQVDVDDRLAMELAFLPSSKKYTLSSDGTSSYGTLLADSLTGQGILQVQNMTPGYYSVFVQTQDGSMVQKAVFRVFDDGMASTAVDMGEQLSDFQSIHIRSASDVTETDIAVDSDLNDVLMAVLGPNINQDSGTGQ